MGKLKLFGCVLAAAFLLAPNTLIPLRPTAIRGSALAIVTGGDKGLSPKDCLEVFEKIRRRLTTSFMTHRSRA